MLGDGQDGVQPELVEQIFIVLWPSFRLDG